VIYHLVENHFDDLLKNRVRYLAKKFHISCAKLKSMIHEHLRPLCPFPGHQFLQTHNFIAVADLHIEKEDEEFKHRWHIDHKLSSRIHEVLRKIYSNLSPNDIIPEAEIISSFLDYVKDISEEYKNEEVIRRWLSMSKSIGKNPRRK